MRYRGQTFPWILNNARKNDQSSDMKKQFLISAGLAIGLMATTAQADCFADYKAKQDDPLRLHYGVIELPDSACSNKSAAKSAISRKIKRDGWTVLSVIGIFDESGLQKRKNSAGAFYLKY